MCRMAFLLQNGCHAEITFQNIILLKQNTKLARVLNQARHACVELRVDSVCAKSLVHNMCQDLCTPRAEEIESPPPNQKTQMYLHLYKCTCVYIQKPTNVQSSTDFGGVPVIFKQDSNKARHACVACWVQNVYQNSFECVPRFIHMCAATRSYVCCDSFICVL